MTAAPRPQTTTIAADAARLLRQTDARDGSIRVGVDVVSIEEFRVTMATKGGAAFVRSRFTEDEQTYCDERPEHLAARWAAKEAVAKAVGTGFRGLRPSQIEIVHEEWGEPTVHAVGADAWPHDAHRWGWSVSIAHEGDAALAVALAVVTPQRELTDTADPTSTPPSGSTDSSPAPHQTKEANDDVR